MMNNRTITSEQIREFGRSLIRDEKSRATVEKYVRDVRAFAAWLSGRSVTKDEVANYKNALLENGYAIRSINSMLASLNSLMKYMGWTSCRVKPIRQQKQIYCAEEKELSREEYLRLLAAAKKKPQLRLAMQTICGTGIRVSELQYFTVECVTRGEVQVHCKGKIRTVLLPRKLRSYLLNYAKERKIRSGAIFLARSGKPLSRSVIWEQMKALCAEAKVSSAKVFPHNLRKLFARAFYGIERDIAKLADILGHSSIDTTRIYIMTSGREHRKQMEKLNLII